MTAVGLEELDVLELVNRFEAITSAQCEASWLLQTARYNRLYRQMVEIRRELQSRAGDQRRALIALLQSDNVQVRMMAANTVLAIFPEQAKRALESVSESGIMPQAADASSMLDALANGGYVPS